MSKYKTIIPIALLAFLIALGSIMITHFFKADLARDIYKENQRLESIVFRTYNREYQRISILVLSMQQMPVTTDEELSSSLQSLINGYGDKGQLPYLINHVSYYSHGQIYFPEADSPMENIRWNHRDLDEIDREKDHPLKMGEFQVMSLPEEESSYLLYTPLKREDILIRIELNKEGIDRYYAQPALKETLEDYLLEWTTLSTEDVKKELDSRISRIYAFEPLKAIIGWSHNEEMKLMVPLPQDMKTRRPFIPGLDMEERTEPEKEYDRFPLRMNPAPGENSGYVLFIASQGAPYYISIEKRIAIDWLQSHLILLGITGVFLLLILQLKRTKNFRSREKEFVASMTHELRTPLTVIQSAAYNLSHGIISPEKVNRYGLLLEDQTKRLSSMIEEILLFSSMEDKNAKPGVPVKTDLPQLIKEIKEEMEALAQEKQISLRWDKEGLPSSLLTYPAEIRLILSNLITNALHHGSPISNETIRIKVRFIMTGHLYLSVEDNGPGIPSSEHKKIFDPFYRSQISREQQTRGSGLGLFIARKKTTLIGGELKLESPYRMLKGEKNTGCRFTLEIPCQYISEENI
ncbi:MAG: HAMP domain-containing sensor histidine kinase [Spirochaetaceae bacterium]|jgi:signal transduction histidine kinase|nr:HAMP domain-containing sensor histidine kinase [Spirochaetaceae bacterium]